MCRRLSSGTFARDGYEVLAELDGDGNGVIDRADAGYFNLLLWLDGNRNGVSEPGELVAPQLTCSLPACR